MKNFHILLFVFSFITLFWFQIGHVEGIVGGFRTKTGQFRYHVSIRANKVHVCNGVIINQLYVLTVAHCVINKINQFENVQFSVVGGAISTRKEGLKTAVEIDVESLYIPKQYEFKDNNTVDSILKEDIALLKLEAPFRYDGTLNEMNLPPVANYTEVPRYKVLTLTGFGYNTPDHSEDYKSMEFVKPCRGCTELRFAEAKFLSQKMCSDLHSTSLSPLHFCAQLKQIDPSYPEGACRGDSGSPLVLDGKYVIGLLSSRSIGCNERDEAAVYTNVGLHLGFISGVLNGHISIPTRSAKYVIKKNIIGIKYKILVED